MQHQPRVEQPHRQREKAAIANGENDDDENDERKTGPLQDPFFNHHRSDEAFTRA